jgi:iron complex transport system permease protein
LATLVVVFGANLAMGTAQISFGDVIAVFGDRLGLGGSPTRGEDAIVWEIRFPRALTAVVAGAGLAAVGTALQGRYRNRLADPQLLGIGPGAAIGAVIGSLVGGVFPAVVGGAIAGALTALLVARLAATRPGEESRFILAGVALGAALSAWLGFIVFGSDSTRVPPIEFWLLGGLNRVTWDAFWVAAFATTLGLVPIVAFSRRLDLFALGEGEARHLGVRVEAATIVLLVATGVVTGTIVGVAGVIGFVGLVVPHVVRRLTGPRHAAQFLVALPMGALAVLAADLFARTILSPTEIPVGLVTAVVGGPFLVWLIVPRGQERA